jgi:predicted nucleotidyltransferase component of viral defense system
MLHLETVESGTFALLNQLSGIAELKDYHLVGGTALALMYGHRKSIDLDLFTTKNFNRERLVSILTSEFGADFQYQGEPNRMGLFCYIKEVKVDFVNYPFSQIDDSILEDGIRFYSSKDIGAMKIQAILNRAVKKDFWDIAELLSHFSIQDLIEWHSQKFPNQMLPISIPTALLYFAESEESEEPFSLNNQSWPEIKSFIGSKVQAYLSIKP